MKWLSILGSALLLVSCASSSPPPTIMKTLCLPMKSYSPQEQQEAAEAMMHLSASAAILQQMMVDYGKLRDANRATCSK